MNEFNLSINTKNINHVCVKEAVFPFARFPGCDISLGPEMRSTGEVMGIDEDFYKAFAKSQIAANNNLPLKGNVFISINNHDKPQIIEECKRLKELGFNIIATSGTHDFLSKRGTPSIEVKKF